MKLRELFALLNKVAQESNSSQLFLCGGTVRDLVISKLAHIPFKEITDIDITNGDDTIHTFAKQAGIELGKNFNIKTRDFDDGHTSIQFGKTKIDFSSGFNSHNIEQLLAQKGIKTPTSLQKEMFSRDFTCNALLQSLDLKIIKDPTKMGIQDIKSKILRTCLAPEITFKSNTNRIIRAVYLAAKLGFNLDKNIIDWVNKNKQVFQQSNQQYNMKMFDKAISYNKEAAINAAKQLGIFELIPKSNAVNNTEDGLLFRRNFDYVKAYFAGNENYNQEYYPYDDYNYPGQNIDNEDWFSGFNSRLENRQRDGKEFKEFEQFRKNRKDKIKQIKRRRLLMQMLKMKNKKQDVFTPHPFYSDEFGGASIMGTNETPLEYYGGSIADGPNEYFNPWNNVYQTTNASANMPIRTAILQNIINGNKTA